MSTVLLGLFPLPILSVTISLFAIPSLFGYIIMIWNTSACAKEAYEALQSAGQVKRFTLTMIFIVFTISNEII